MSRKRMLAIVGAVLLAGVAVAVVVLRGQARAPGDDDNFAADLDARPKCWVKMKPSATGKCSGRVYKGQCYMANWSECAKYY
ncbi:hypothetical protein JYK02_38230 [Corallococcus macrosporus]|uniref:DUF3551 domain-containing protein n=1 Tax=Corallococcus macrosporus TaxID=35 RepID=A0ABS3DPU9_9BACT|nr:hypothetical protein [Corallococcus macrosporus]MBN8233372.1 hypothetical protein [Corallococcus macrosporus]